MTEYTEKFELVLYYNRKISVKPIDVDFEAIKKSNPNLCVDQLLDIYSDCKNKYKEDIIKYENNRNDSVISDFVLIPENESFFIKVKEFEKNNFFVEWNKSSKKLIDETIINILK